MKTNRFIIAALSFAAAAVSCQKEDFGGVENARHTEAATIVTGEMTRTSLSGKEIHWTNDDVIAVFDNANYKNVFNISEAEGSYASFSGSVTSGTTQIYAVYPENLAVSANGSSLKVNIPSDQTSKVGSFAEEHNISVAKGTKTPGVEAIENITFKNVCALLKFTIPSYIEDAKSVSFSTSTPISGEATVDFSGDVPALSVSSNGSNSVTMTGSYSAGSEFIFVLAPGTIQGFTVTVTTDKANWTITKNSTVTFEAGRYKNLGTLELEQVSAASASASHTYSGSTLTGTNVTVSLNVPAATQKYVTALSLEVKNSAGKVVRTSSKIAANQTIAANDSWPYLPQGNYTVSGSYTLADGTVKTISAVSFTSPAPTFAVTSNAYTSYTKYQTSGASAANQVKNDAICDMTSATVAISDAILSNSNYSSLKGGYSYALDGNTTTTSNVTGQSWGKHVVTATYTFDGVAISGSTDCHVTGLPYSANPPKSDRWDASSNVKFRSGDVLFGNGGGAGSITLTPHVPGNINVTVSAKIDAYGAPVNTTTYVDVSDSRIASCTSNSGLFNYKTVTWESSANGTLTSSNATVKAGTTYGLGTTQGRIYYININYR